ncbi:MAG: hypothetical protein KKA84_12550 [Bacteroidetes bacterium]|nr:hypothetical protein [Bacteroidota bacterium]
MKILFLMLTINVMMLAQNVSDFPALSESDLDSMTIVSEKVFDGNSLWGHINGGADLYLEYGFDKLLLQNVEYQGTVFRVEFYKMNDSEAAFGIFSIKRFKCVESYSLPVDVCITENQIQSAIGRFYISISNEEETEEALTKSHEIFLEILDKSKELPYLLPELFYNPRLKKYSSQIKYIKGQLGLQNGFPMWEMMFEGIEKYSAYILPISDADATLAQIHFGQKGSLELFLQNIEVTMPDQYNLGQVLKKDHFQIIVTAEEEILFCESEGDSLIISDYIKP